MDRKPFFDHIRGPLFAGSLSGPQVAGMTAILDGWDSRGLTDIRWLAYMLATSFHETARTMQPIREFGGTKARYAPYYGRGFVQLTWKAGYAKAGKVIGVDLVANPDRALELPIATRILFDGMIVGWFTGKKLSDYIGGAKCDYVGARRIINGTDKAQTIAGYATAFEKALRAAVVGKALQPGEPPPVTLPPVDVPAPKPAPPATPEQKGAAGAAAVVIGAGTAAASTSHPWLWLGVGIAALIAGAIIFFIVKSKVSK